MRASVAEISGRSSSVAALLAMMVVMMAMLITQAHCFSINQTITVSYSTSCDGLNDDLSCLVGQTDLDSDEFMLDSEFSRRILKNTNSEGLTGTTGNPDKPVCDRGPDPKTCHPEANLKARPPYCDKAPTHRECHRFDRKNKKSP